MTSPPLLTRLQTLPLPPFLDLYQLLVSTIALPILLHTPRNLQVSIPPFLQSVIIHLSRIHPRAILAVSHPFILRNPAKAEPLQNNIHNPIPSPPILLSSPLNLDANLAGFT